MDISSIALGGLEQASARFEQAARQVSTSALGTASGAGDTVDLSTAAVDLLSARNQFQASLQVVRIGDRMARQALDLLA